MKNKKLINQLEKEYKPQEGVEIEIGLPLGLSETNYHRGTWRGKGFTCTSNVYWKRGRLKNGGMDVFDLMELLKAKTIGEMSDEDFDNLELLETQDGYTDVSDIEWDDQPTDEELEELDTNELYTDSEITDCEYHVDAGGIRSLTVSIRKDTLTIDEEGYNLSLAPRIRKWTKKDKADYEARMTVAIAEMIELQSTYDLILESEVTENLPTVEVDATEAPVLRAKRFEVVSESDSMGRDVIGIVVWAENGPAFRIHLTGLRDSVALRNSLARHVDGFGRPFMQQCEVDDAYDPPVEYDFGDGSEDVGD